MLSLINGGLTIKFKLESNRQEKENFVIDSIDALQSPCFQRKVNQVGIRGRLQNHRITKPIVTQSSSQSSLDGLEEETSGDKRSISRLSQFNSQIHDLTLSDIKNDGQLITLSALTVDGADDLSSCEDKLLKRFDRSNDSPLQQWGQRATSVTPNTITVTDFELS